jgi:holo-[acyl-carrier protein] synthase
MKVLTGIDIVDIEDFRDSLNSGGSKFIDRIFTDKEKKNVKIFHLAGIFAAKEAVLKALSFPIGSWKQIEICNRKDGRPFIQLADELKASKKIISCDLSISHSTTSAIAIFLAVL